MSSVSKLGPHRLEELADDLVLGTNSFGGRNNFRPVSAGGCDVRMRLDQLAQLDKPLRAERGGTAASSWAVWCNAAKSFFAAASVSRSRRPGAVPR